MQKINRLQSALLIKNQMVKDRPRLKFVTGIGGLDDLAPELMADQIVENK